MCRFIIINLTFIGLCTFLIYNLIEVSEHGQILVTETRPWVIPLEVLLLFLMIALALVSLRDLRRR